MLFAVYVSKKYPSRAFFDVELGRQEMSRPRDEDEEIMYTIPGTRRLRGPIPGTLREDYACVVYEVDDDSAVFSCQRLIDRPLEAGVTLGDSTGLGIGPLEASDIAAGRFTDKDTGKRAPIKRVWPTE